jgi:hypothetical protein
LLYPSKVNDLTVFGVNDVSVLKVIPNGLVRTILLD